MLDNRTARGGGNVLLALWEATCPRKGPSSPPVTGRQTIRIGRAPCEPGVGPCGLIRHNLSTYLCDRTLEPWVDRFTFESEDAEDALVNAAQGLLADEALQGFDTEGELA